MGGSGNAKITVGHLCSFGYDTLTNSRRWLPQIELCLAVCVCVTCLGTANSSSVDATALVTSTDS
ncbi:hypothetical protein ASPFODRAFT_39685 [Aspergillus luchuensis CBS 106.47]|uniref:Uncharacterized protein n=1 Tax=Aspergillus luchuensis (strain CBS 106.47) TaxID=1137211 RepID=A0A1M3TZX5_ASPLC|nr:hypothetical protein ASPFODRAFT_39685 [Aspergillus luchuensis CBS 106.47]